MFRKWWHSLTHKDKVPKVPIIEIFGEYVNLNEALKKP